MSIEIAQSYVLVPTHLILSDVIANAREIPNYSTVHRPLRMTFTTEGGVVRL